MVKVKKILLNPNETENDGLRTECGNYLEQSSCKAAYSQNDAEGYITDEKVVKKKWNIEDYMIEGTPMKKT